MQRAFALELKSLTQEGTFEGLASTYGGEPDAVNDIVDPGAFSSTLTASKERPLLLEHRDPIGMVQLIDSPAGLIAKGRLSLELQKAKDAYVLLRDGIAKHMSIGYETVKSQYVGDVRHLVEVKLWEVSVVLFGANQNALISGVKNFNHQRIETALHEFKRDILAAINRS